MHPVDNSQFTEEQRTEAYRREHMAQVIKQTKALESIRGIMITFTALFVIGAVMYLLLVAFASSGRL